MSIKGKILYWMGQKTAGLRAHDQIGTLNYPQEYETAGWREVKFQLLEKTFLHLFLRFVSVPPVESWPEQFTGTRKEFAEFLRDEYFAHEKHQRRYNYMARVLYWGLKYWEHDQASEPIDYLFYQMLTGKREWHFDRSQNLIPENWYMDSDPRLNGEAGRFEPDPAGMFRVIGRDPDSITLDTEITQPILQIGERYLKIDPEKGEQIASGWKYPVLFQADTCTIQRTEVK